MGAKRPGFLHVAYRQAWPAGHASITIVTLSGRLQWVQGVCLNPTLRPNYFIFLGNFKKSWVLVSTNFSQVPVLVIFIIKCSFLRILIYCYIFRHETDRTLLKASLTFKCMTEHLFADFSYSIALDTYL